MARLTFGQARRNYVECYQGVSRQDMLSMLAGKVDTKATFDVDQEKARKADKLAMLGLLLEVWFRLQPFTPLHFCCPFGSVARSTRKTRDVFLCLR